MSRPKLRMSRRVPRNRIAGLLMACLAFGAQARLSRAELPISLPAQQKDAGAAIGAPWWAGFGESALAELQRAVRAHADAGILILGSVHMPPVGPQPTETQVAAAFVTTRVLNVRLAVAGELMASAAQLRNLAAAGRPTPQRALAMRRIDAQMAQTRAHVDALRRRRDAGVDALAVWCGVTADTLPEALYAALLESRIPSFDAQAGEPLLARLAATPGDSLQMGRAGLRNEQELRARLSDVQRRSEQVAMQAEALNTRQIDVTAIRWRLEVGAGSEEEFLSAYQQWLLDGDRLAVASGELAQAWIRLQVSTNGQALAAHIQSD